MNTTDTRAAEQAASLNETGRCAYAALVDMVAALQCDYDRLEELREERDGFEVNADDDDATESGTDKSIAVWAAVRADDAAELAGLEAAAGDCTDQDEARERIQEDALELTVRSDWTALGETLEPAEFCILLTTGGPAVRISGELRDNEPHRAWLEVQDWGTPWTHYTGHGQDAVVDSDVLLAYAGCFYFGEG